MTEDIWVQIIAGIILPPILAIIVGEKWSVRLKTLATMGTVIILGGLLSLLQHDWRPSTDEVGLAILVIWGLSAGTYEMGWKNLGVNTLNGAIFPSGLIPLGGGKSTPEG